MSSKVKIELVEMDTLPICPHCERELGTVTYKNFALGARTIYACPHCRKVLAGS